MTEFNWFLQTPLDAIIFDCDGTLSQIEGINYLAGLNGVETQVTALTETAMSHTGVTRDLYHQRLSRVRPSLQQTMQLAQQYYKTLSPDVIVLIAAFQKLNKTLFVISAGINPAVTLFADKLGIPAHRVFAVDTHYDEHGRYQSYDEYSPLTDVSGKALIIERIKCQFPHVMFVGDGMNDVEASRGVDRFVGYGGAFFRERIALLSPFYIKCTSLLPVLALALTEQEYRQSPTDLQALFERSVDLLQLSLTKGANDENSCC